MRQQARNVVRGATYRAGLYHLFSRTYGGLGAILCMHRVVVSKDGSLARQLTVTTSFLDEVVRHFLADGTKFVNMGEVQRLLVNGGRRSERFVALTFDDGY